MILSQWYQRKPVSVILVALIALGIVVSLFKLSLFGTTHSSDWDTYVLTARYMAGEQVDNPGGVSIPQRYLKPLYPEYLALAHTFVDYDSAALAQSVFFYLALIVALFFLAYEFFEDRFTATVFVVLTAFSYPVLKYGIDVYTETGAWLSYVLSLYLTLRFLKRPSKSLFLANVAVVTVGFLWKEYVIVSAAVFGLAILFHAGLSLKQKILALLSYAAVFLAVQIPWQVHVMHVFHFSYLDWYRMGGTSGFSYQFTFKDILKSTAALLGLMWVFVPLGFRRLPQASSPRRLFIYLSAPIPLIGYAWGYISSRLLYVIAPPMLLVALLGIREWPRRTQIMIAAVAFILNIIWLALSYRIAL